MSPRCVFCGRKCTDADYCHGCQSYICAKCDHPEPDKRPQGVEHEPVAHRAHAEAS